MQQISSLDGDLYQSRPIPNAVTIEYDTRLRGTRLKLMCIYGLGQLCGAWPASEASGAFLIAFAANAALVAIWTKRPKAKNPLALMGLCFISMNCTTIGVMILRIFWKLG